MEKVNTEKKKSDKKTIVVNLFAGPGSGKSTGAAYIFSKLKMAGVDCEYVSEFAKDKVWEHNDEVLKCQFYITGKQAYKISRVNGKVDVIITDSPILIGALYGISDNPHLEDAIFYEFGKYKNLNFFVERIKKYNPNGRMQTEEEAKTIDRELKSMLEKYNIEYENVYGDIEGYEEIVKKVKEMLNIKND